MAKKKSQAERDMLEELAGTEFLKRAGVDPNAPEVPVTRKQIEELLTEAATDKDARRRLQLLMRTNDDVRKLVESVISAPEPAPAPVQEVKRTGKAAGKKELTEAQKAEAAASEKRTRTRRTAAADEEARALAAARQASEEEKLRKLAEVETKAPVEKVGREVAPEEVVAPKMPEAARKEGPKRMGPEKAQLIREEFVKRGIDPNILIERSTTGIKRLDDIPDTPEARAAINRVMNEEMAKPEAKARVRQREAAARAEPGTAKTSLTEAEKRKNAQKGRGKAVPKTIFEERPIGIDQLPVQPGERPFRVGDRTLRTGERPVRIGAVSNAPEVTETISRTITNPLTVDDVKSRNFARMDSRLKIKAADGLLEGRVVMTNVEKAKLGEMVMLRDELRRVPEIAGGAKPPLLDELEAKLRQLEKEVAGTGRPNVQGVVGSHGRFFTKGKVRSGVMDFQKTGEVVRAKMAEEARAARGPTMGERLAQDPKELRKRARMTARQLRGAFGVQSNREMAQILKENGLLNKDAVVKRQEDLVRFMTEDQVKGLNELIKNRRAAGGRAAAPAAEAAAEAAEEALPRLDVPEAAAPAPAAATTRMAAAGGAAAPATAAKTGAAMAGIGAAAELAAEAAAPGATAAATGLAGKKEVFGLRRSLKRLGKNAEAGMLKALRAQGVEIASLDQLPAERLEWAKRWVSGSGKGAGVAARTAAAAAPTKAMVKAPDWIPGRAGPSMAAPTAAAGAIPESKAIVPYRPPAAAAARAGTGSVNAKWLADMLGGRAAAQAGTGAIDVKGLADMLGDGGKTPPVGRLAGLMRFLGPAAAIFSMYQLADLVKQGTVDEADERRLKALQALGAVSGGMQQDAAMRDQIRGMQQMVDLAAIQRRQALDEMNRQYTDDRALNALLSANQAQLAAISQPSRPSVAEMMMRM